MTQPMAKAKKKAAKPPVSEEGQTDPEEPLEPQLASPGFFRSNRPQPANRDGKPANPVPTWRAGFDFIVMIGGAVLIALLIKAYIFDVYLIPSGSMETTLHGRPDGGDRILCSKLSYRFRPVERWEVAVFEFPYENARRFDSYGVSEQYRGQNFVKRVVGLPGEALAIGRGDIWVRPGDARAEYRRVVKPDKVQRGMWLNVYEEDFADLPLSGLHLFWKTLGGEVELKKGGPLILKPGSDAVRLDYRPQVPVGPERMHMVELPGVPDRYTLRQPVQFRCQALKEDGTPCDHVYVKTFQTQNMQARCPVCGSFQDEASAVFYYRRSGLPIVGRYAVDPRYAPQGEEKAVRDVEYHIVPDLRAVLDATFASEQTTLAVTLREDERFVQAVFFGDGRVELRINGEASAPMNRALSGIRPGRASRIEFYVVDGQARVFVDSTSQALLDSPVWADDRRPFPRALPKASGLGLTAAGGDVTIRHLWIDRDIFYYSSWEREQGSKFPSMSSQGEVFIKDDSFFPMGDHCTSSYDARSWGPVPLSFLRGPALLIWWPPNRVRLIDAP